MRKSALYGFVIVVTLLVASGLLILSSASQAYSTKFFGTPYHFMTRQFIYLGIGLLAAAGVAFFDYRHWRESPWLAVALYAVVFLMLLAVFPPLGHKVKGSFRWIFLGPVNVQPSEFAKLALVIVLAVVLDLASWKIELFRRGVLFPMLAICGFAIPVLLEPDFGSVMVIMLVGGTLLLVAGTRWRYLCLGALLGGGVFVAKVMSNANRMARIAAWIGVKINVGAEVLDAAAQRAQYQADQALIAIKNGGLFGVGLGNSMQKELYLPEAHTDFIFAIGAEEIGMGFSVGVILLFLAFFCFSVYIACKASDRLGRLLALGMGILVFYQAMFNIGVVCSALPTKGMALPFFSYGGTNIISVFIAVGTILSVGIHSYREQHRAIKRSVFV